MDEQEKEKIRMEARELLDKFASKLESVKLKGKKKEEKEGGFREERSGNTPEAGFRKRMFANAPEKNADNIIAEKKKW
jgi:hypothetical protein